MSLNKLLNIILLQAYKALFDGTKHNYKKNYAWLNKGKGGYGVLEICHIGSKVESLAHWELPNICLYI
jgi:hypothetical protein